MSAAPTIDDVKAFWNARPCNIRHSDKPVGSKAYFDEVEARKYFVEPHIPGFAQFDRWRGKRVLEIGCGIGTDAVNFARAGAAYTGVELSAESLAVARQRFEVFGLPGALIEGDAETLSAVAPTGSFDLVYSIGVLHHTPQPAKAIAEIRTLIAPTGELRIMLYAKNSWKAAMIDAGLDQPEAQYGCPIATCYDADDVTALLDGFDILSIRQDHIFPYKVDAYKAYRYEREDWFAAMPEAMFRALETTLGWHLLITAKPRG